jgi:colanic acid/amylovoran biosynthesis glycosyltransferase
MEAMAMEIPCVATRVNGIPELIRDGVDGLLVAPSDDEALARKIAVLMDDAALRRRIGSAGRQRVMEKYDLNQNTARLASIFHRRIGESAQLAERSARSESVQAVS